jgi:tRNA(Ile)-lysidine synthase
VPKGLRVRVSHGAPFKFRMIRLLFPIPRQITVALSGGVDSVAITDFLSRKHDVSCAFFHHGTEASEQAFRFVAEFCTERNLPMMVSFINKDKPKKQSWEEHWRIQRYDFLESLNMPVITAHNLDDCVETYLYGSLHGVPKVIPRSRNNILRPFLTNPKSEFIDWAIRKDLKWCEDSSNRDTTYMRNYIRHELMPHALKVNPGLYTVVKKIVEKQNTPL